MGKKVVVGMSGGVDSSVAAKIQGLEKPKSDISEHDEDEEY